MKSERLISMLAIGEASGWERTRAMWLITCSGAARRRYRHYSAVSHLLGAAMADPDEVVTLRFSPRAQRIPTSLMTLAILGLIISLASWKVISLREPAKVIVPSANGKKCHLVWE